MTRIATARLTAYQLDVLCDTAGLEVPIFLLPRPTSNDSVTQQRRLDKFYKQIKALVAMGFVEDVSDDFRQYIEEHNKTTGRRFLAYGLSELGFCMFQDGVPETVN